MHIRQEDWGMVKSFLHREALDFDLTAEAHDAWIDNVVEKIQQGLTKYKGGADFLHIVSLTNMGQVQRKLTLTPSAWYQEGEVTITLCTCGRKECWGSIAFPTKWRNEKCSSHTIE